MKKVRLVLLCFLLFCSVSNALTEETHFITTGTTAVQNGIYEIQSTCMLGGNATDVFIYARGNTTINNAKIAFVPITENKAYTGTGTIDYSWHTERCTRQSGNSHSIRDGKLTLTSHPALGKIALTPGGNWLKMTDTGYQSSRRGTANCYSFQCDEEDITITNLLSGASQGPLTYTGTETIDRFGRYSATVTITFPASVKSCVYGSCTLINSTVEGAPAVSGTCTAESGTVIDNDSTLTKITCKEGSEQSASTTGTKTVTTITKKSGSGGTVVVPTPSPL